MNVQHSKEAPGQAPVVQPSEIMELARRLAYLELSTSDRRLLNELQTRLRPHETEFVDTFYRHLFAFDETARFLQDPQLVARLKQAQQLHFGKMLAAEWNDEYLARCFKVGDAHAHVGISPQIFLGAYNQYLQFCVERLAGEFGEPGQRFGEIVRALQKAVLFDIGLTLEAYFSRATANLRRALDLVYQANAELRQFAHLTSHDLKTPLATMANLCDEVLDEFGDRIPNQAAKLIQAARNRAFRMGATIDELLQSAISLHEEPALDAVPIERVLGETVELLRPILEQKKIEVTLPADLPIVRANYVRIREVFFNLLSNAIKFNDKVPGRIDIRAALEDRTCTISVVDNGPGIPADEVTRIFLPFRRASAHRDVPGSGLGLYFAKSLVEQQGGRIWAESEPGQGSMFHVQLVLAAPGEP